MTEPAGPMFDGPDEMGRDIAGSAAALEATLAGIEALGSSFDELRRAASAVVLMGTGMSLAVANAAAPAWRRATGPEGRRLIVRESTAAAFGSDDGLTWSGDELVVAVSKSGTSPETVAAARLAAEAGAMVVAVTAETDSPLARGAALIAPTPSGEEAGAGTRSATAALGALLALCGALDSSRAGREALAESLQATAEGWPEVQKMGPDLAAAPRTWIAGFGCGAGLAQGAAILWHEKAHRQAVALSVSEFRHGPVEAGRPGDALIVVDPDQPVAARSSYLARLRGEAADLGLTTVWLAAEPAGTAPIPLRLGAGPEAVLEALVRLQQLARATAQSAGTYRDGFAVLRSVVQPVADL
jgi:glucosamine--fructose-6-phosphate aminotransferase (isomerizing)